jgi:hypothetical protein
MFRVCIYVDGATVPVRTYPSGTYAEAETIAGRLGEQLRRNGWAHVIRIEEV